MGGRRVLREQTVVTLDRDSTNLVAFTKIRLRHKSRGLHKYSNTSQISLSQSLSSSSTTSSGKAPATTRKLFIVGGDQGAESVFAHTKNTMRRMNTLGRKSGFDFGRASVNALTAAELQWQPGLENVLVALAAYRKFAMDTLSPKQLFKEHSRWLGCMEPF